MKEKVLITGGSGLIGSKLSEMLIKRNYEVAHLSRHNKGSGQIKTIVWNVNKMQLDTDKIAEYDYIIHLAGAGIVDKPWTNKRKKVILESRTKSIELLKNTIIKNNKKPKSFISASAIGYYGVTTNETIFKESDRPGNDFLANTCIAWEKAADQIGKLNIPTSKIRLGLVITDKGGALEKISKPIKLGFGAALGSGKQYMPWIHIEDLCRIFIFLMENQLEGVFNAVVPPENQLTNYKFTQTIAKVLNKNLWLPNIPGIFMKILLGNRALLILEGSRIDAKKIQEKGFKFNYEKLEDALKEIYN